jgi:hydroxyethylthiazole kinase
VVCSESGHAASAAPTAPPKENTMSDSTEAIPVGVPRVAWPEPSVMAALTGLRKRAPLVHCITNIVATPITANVLLAIGAAPAMVLAAEEAGPFAAVAGAVLINVGTIVPADTEAMLAAAGSAHARGTPWVLDPVAVGFLSLRTRIAHELLAFHPTIIRGNASEILALAGAGGGGKGVDSTDTSETAIASAKRLAQQTGAVVAVSGVVDYVTDGAAVIAVTGGHVLMTRVTGIGCALGAVLAAFASGGETALQAAVHASAVFGAAGARAAQRAAYPGSFAVAFLDELAAIGSDAG